MPAKINRVAVVVLNWNGAAIIGACLDSLIGQDYPNFQIVVVDNGSSDESKKFLELYEKRLKDKIYVIYNLKNSGFSGGVNTGIKYALRSGFDGVALLNNDAVAETSWLSGLVKASRQDPEVGITTGLLLHESGQTIDSTGDWYSIWGLAFPRSRGEKLSKSPDSGFVFGATGGASLYRVEMLWEIGQFDEEFFAYYEDVDISFRAQLTGWKVFYTKEAIAYHKQGATSGRIPGFTKYQMFKNLPLLFIKNVPRSLTFKIGPRFVLIYFLMFINAVLRGDFVPAVKGFVMSLYYLPSAVAKRALIQRAKKVTDEYIDSLLWKDLPPTQAGIVRKLFGRKNGTAN